MKIIFKAMLGVCFLAVTSAGAQSKKIHVTIAKGAPVTKSMTKITVTKDLTNEEKFIKNHPEITAITWAPGGVATLNKKDGSSEKYSLDMFEDEKAFIKKYGEHLHKTIPQAQQPEDGQ